MLAKPELVFPRALERSQRSVPEVRVFLQGLGLYKTASALLFLALRDEGCSRKGVGANAASIFCLQELLSAFLVWQQAQGGASHEWAAVSICIHAGLAIAAAAVVGVRGLLQGLRL